MKRLLGDRLWLLCILLGVLLLAGAGGLVLSEQLAQEQAVGNAQQVLQKAQTLIPTPVDRVPQERGNNAMAAMQIDGINVVGILEVSKFGRTLPLAASWDADLVGAIPCRFTGSIYDRSLIIGSSDAQGQFDFAGSLEVRDRIVLTDMEGGRYTYRVEAIQHSQHAGLEKLQSGGYALTVFLKDSRTGEYLLIRCQPDI